MAVFDKLTGLPGKARRLLRGGEDPPADDVGTPDAERDATRAARRAAQTEQTDVPAAFRKLGIDERATLSAARAAYRAKARPLIVAQSEGRADATAAAEQLAALEDALVLVEEALLPLPKRW